MTVVFILISIQLKISGPSSRQIVSLAFQLSGNTFKTIDNSSLCFLESSTSLIGVSNRSLGTTEFSA